MCHWEIPLNCSFDWSFIAFVNFNYWKLSITPFQKLVSKVCKRAVFTEVFFSISLSIWKLPSSFSMNFVIKEGNFWAPYPSCHQSIQLSANSWPVMSTRTSTLIVFETKTVMNHTCSPWRCEPCEKTGRILKLQFCQNISHEEFISTL